MLARRRLLWLAIAGIERSAEPQEDCTCFATSVARLALGCFQILGWAVGWRIGFDFGTGSADRIDSLKLPFELQLELPAAP